MFQSRNRILRTAHRGHMPSQLPTRASHWTLCFQRVLETSLKSMLLSRKIVRRPILVNQKNVKSFLVWKTRLSETDTTEKHAIWNVLETFESSSIILKFYSSPLYVWRLHAHTQRRRLKHTNTWQREAHTECRRYHRSFGNPRYNCFIDDLGPFYDK